MSKQINQVEVLQQEGTNRSRALPCRGVVDRSTVGGSVDGLLIVADGRRSSVVGNHGDGVELARLPAG